MEKEFLVIDKKPRVILQGIAHYLADISSVRSSSEVFLWTI
jgi:hypothetical protein